MAVTRYAPKDARVEFVGCELFDVPCFRHAFGGVLLGIAQMFCEKAYVHELAGGATSRFQWA